MKNKQFHIRVTSEELELIHTLAYCHRLSASEYILMLVRADRNNYNI